MKLFYEIWLWENWDSKKDWMYTPINPTINLIYVYVIIEYYKYKFFRRVIL